MVFKNQSSNHITEIVVILTLDSSEDAMEGWNRRGQANHMNDTPPEKWFWTPQRLVGVPTSLRRRWSISPCKKRKADQTTTALHEGSRNFLKGTLFGAFSSPHTFLHPSHVIAQIQTGEASLLTVGAVLFTVELLCLQVLLRHTFPL